MSQSDGISIESTVMQGWCYGDNFEKRTGMEAGAAGNGAPLRLGHGFFVEEGVEKISTGSVMLDQAPDPARDKLTINGTTYIILVSREKKSFTSLRYYEVFFQ